MGEQSIRMVAINARLIFNERLSNEIHLLVGSSKFKGVDAMQYKTAIGRRVPFIRFDLVNTRRKKAGSGLTTMPDCKW